jgi:hypothetical protein
MSRIVSSIDISKPGTAEPRQLLTLRVTSVHEGCEPFKILLDSADYNELRNKLLAQVRNSRDVIIRMSLSDQFVARFKEYVEGQPSLPTDRDLVRADSVPIHFSNTLDFLMSRCTARIQQTLPPTLLLPPQSDELCLICMLKQPNVLMRSDGGGGTRCRCPPRCCLDCLGHWFANSQDQNRPSTWMSGFAECPACRARFTVAEVSRVQAS